MELFTTELTKFKNLSENFTKNCELLQTEVNLLNKLLFVEQKFSDHLLKQLFVLYDKNFAHIQQNYRYFDDWNQLEKQKSIAKENEIQVKKLRQELKTWRKDNNRLNNDVQSTDHTYSTGTNSMTKIKDKSLKNNNEREGTVSQSVSSEPSAVVPEIKPKAQSSSVSVKLEVIPKTEPEECFVCEETVSASEGTDSASEGENDCFIEGVEPTPTTSQSSQPFLFVSEYLSKNKAFSHLLDKNKEQEQKEDKRIDIDLNSDSESLDVLTTSANPESVIEGVPHTNIFDDNIVDLTPKHLTSKKSPKKSFIKTRVTFGKKKKNVKNLNKRSVEPNTSSISISDNIVANNRIIGSNRKKIHFNADNTISIIEVNGNARKKPKTEDKKSKTEDKKSKIENKKSKNDELIPSPNLLSNEDSPNLSRTEKAKTNEDIIKTSKKIVLKDKIYYCRWKKCSYNTESRGNAIRHLWKHTGETPFKCQLCPQGFRDKRHLTKHMIIHNVKNDRSLSKTAGVYKPRGTGDVVCPECKGKYAHFQHMIRHMRRIHGKQKADNCRQQYYKQRSLILTNNTSDDRQKTSSSKRKSIERSSKTKLDLSIKAIPPKKLYKKTKNLTESPEKSAVDALSDEEGAEDLWKCDFKSCLSSYSYKSNLKRHQMEIHKKLSKPLFYGNIKNSGKEVKYFIPKTPQKVSTSSKKKTVSLSNTTVPKAEGTVTKAFACKNCKNSYQTINGLYKHKKKYHQSKITWSSAAQKANKFQSNTTVQNSTENNNSAAERAFACPESGCGSRFVWAKNLKTHLKNKHNITATEVVSDIEEEEESDGQFYCPYSGCGFQAFSRTGQITHYRTHFTSEDKPFKCLIKGCDYSSQKLSLLKYHVLNRHSEQQFFRAMEETGVHYPFWY